MNLTLAFLVCVCAFMSPSGAFFAFQSSPHVNALDTWINFATTCVVFAQAQLSTSWVRGQGMSREGVWHLHVSANAY